MNRNGPLALAFHAVFVAFILAPLVVVVLVAFTPEGYLALPVHGASLRWFRALLDAPDFVASFWISIRLGLAASVLALAAMLPAALAIGRHRFRGRTLILAIVMSPLMVPAVVLGIALLRFLSWIGIQGTFGGLVLCHAVVVGPYILRMLLAAAGNADRRLEHAAASLGAGAFTTLRRVVLPALMPGLVGGFVLAFVASFDELTVSLFVASPQTTPLPLRLFSHISEMTDPLAASVSTVILVISAVLLLLLDRLYGVDRLFTATRP